MSASVREPTMERAARPTVGHGRVAPTAALSFALLLAPLLVGGASALEATATVPEGLIEPVFGNVTATVDVRVSCAEVAARVDDASPDPHIPARVEPMAPDGVYVSGAPDFRVPLMACQDDPTAPVVVQRTFGVVVDDDLPAFRPQEIVFTVTLDPSPTDGAAGNRTARATVDVVPDAQPGFNARTEDAQLVDTGLPMKAALEVTNHGNAALAVSFRSGSANVSSEVRVVPAHVGMDRVDVALAPGAPGRHVVTVRAEVLRDGTSTGEVLEQEVAFHVVEGRPTQDVKPLLRSTATQVALLALVPLGLLAAGLWAVRRT